ncbi:hypothetical protein QFZ37_002087 [Chryseobacterium ginsenosidimutans]|uniref:hypothetical protein n=1 Tax=Chryseobacterium ginsenosidimutans TaxID=687846 RepID=UPI0027847324|nr:hypothetical protein [Chryseobacterium ginsenosidimutans]MDQ0593718.1 hypothetical protein [Chryseobacterium ginsenosidimutans]
MRKIYLIILAIFTVCCCKKENHKVDIKIKKENYNPTEYFSFPTNIKKWKNYKEITVNDSLKKVRGEFENYKIEGYINQYNQKINWWNIVNKKDTQADNVRLEYRIIDNKEYVNQYINYDTKNGDDTKNSLFYLKEKLNKPNTLRYKFYTPNKKNKLNTSATVFLSFFLNNKEIKTDDLKCLKKDNYYYVDIDVPTDNHVSIKGLFEEGYEYDGGEMGINNIYILDTLR